MATLLDSLTSLATPAVGQIAQRLGETDATVSRGIQASFASLLGALVMRVEDPSSLDRIFDLVRNRPASTDLTSDVHSMVGGIAGGAPTSGDEGALLTTLFGGRTNDVGDLITQTAGFENPSSGSSLLGFAAPLVLAFLGKAVRDDGMRAGGLSNLLVGERNRILAAVPAGLMELVAVGRLVPLVEVTWATRGVAAAATARMQGGVRWAWPALGIAAVGLAWFLVTRGRAPSASPTIGAGAAAFDSARTRAGAAVQTAGGEVTGVIGGLGALVKRVLRGGVTLDIPERGIESKLIAFIENGSRLVDDTMWFDFDRLNFATGSATILPESQVQLDNIVAVLKAYPNVNVKVGGYTDDVGGAAANLRLSRRRAEAVKQALVSNGIPAKRLQAEGYGEQHPVADNATEEGRARNRRIALKVTKK